jgi:uncharacterized protein YpmB
MGLITPNSKNNQCVKIILILTVVIVLIYYFLFNCSKKKLNKVEGFENIDSIAYAEQEAKKVIDEQYLTKMEEVGYQSMGVPSVPSDNTVYVPPANNASIPLSQQEIKKIREDTYKTVLQEDTPAGLSNLVGNIQSSGGREIIITNSKDVNEMMVDSTFKLKVNIPGMPSYNIGEDYEKVKNRNPNNFYLSVEKLMPNCTILSSTGQCYDVYINDKKINETVYIFHNYVFSILFVSQSTKVLAK